MEKQWLNTIMKEINIRDIKKSAVELISDNWGLVTAGNEEKFNTMTVSWGGLGEIWGKDAVFIFIRPQRYTFEFIEKEELFTLSFYEAEYKDALKICGSKSGRDIDKAKECGLTPDSDRNDSGRAVWFDEARLVIKAKKLYAEWIKPESMTDPAPMYTYANGDFHKMYVCEITDVLVKEA